jgi:ABC-type phosphonate transport system ATPase subunit
LIGDSGTGKSHLLIALGTEAAISGFRVKYTLATKLANELVEAADEKTLSKTSRATDGSICCASTNSGTCSWTAAAPSCSFRS